MGAVAALGSLRAVKVPPCTSTWLDESGALQGDSSGMWLIDGDEHPTWEHLMREEWGVLQ